VDGEWHEHVESGFVAMILSIVGRARCSLYIGGRKRPRSSIAGPIRLPQPALRFQLYQRLRDRGAERQRSRLGLASCWRPWRLLSDGRREEAFLGREFGAVYIAYKARTPRFWPRFSLWRDEDL
jgi:hypothetical protein